MFPRYSEESNTNTGETRAEIGDDGIVAQAASTGHLEEALADTTGGMDAAAMAQEAARETAAAHEQRLEQQRQAEAKVKRPLAPLHPQSHRPLTPSPPAAASNHRRFVVKCAVACVQVVAP